MVRKSAFPCMASTCQICPTPQDPLFFFFLFPHTTNTAHDQTSTRTHGSPLLGLARVNLKMSMSTSGGRKRKHAAPTAEVEGASKKDSSRLMLDDIFAPTMPKKVKAREEEKGGKMEIALENFRR